MTHLLHDLEKIFEPYFDSLVLASELEPYQDYIVQKLIKKFKNEKDGNLNVLIEVLKSMPDAGLGKVLLGQDVISYSCDVGLNAQSRINECLFNMAPWRKGPFSICGIDIDAEWRCDMKWRRLEQHISPLENKVVLDVGSGNGYYSYRMVGAGARYVLGVDPSWLSVFQFMAINKYMRNDRVSVLPLTLEDIGINKPVFDTVFSMGVLYHRRSPLDHILDLYKYLKPGGEVVLETLVVEGELGHSFMPPGRYARMNNVWFLPSIPTLVSWMEKTGFDNARVVDQTHTSIEEQRTTKWKPGTSLKDYLSADNAEKTIEGHPAPLRAIIVAKKPTAIKKLRRYHID